MPAALLQMLPGRQMAAMTATFSMAMHSVDGEINAILAIRMRSAIAKSADQCKTKLKTVTHQLLT
jgi:hypothetical protein